MKVLSSDWLKANARYPMSYGMRACSATTTSLRGRLVSIETTSRKGIVNLRVRIGQEERQHPNVSGIRPGVPEEGKPAPAGWE